MIDVLYAPIIPFRKALPVRVSHGFAADSAVFDDDHLVPCAGLVPVMALAEQTGLSDLLAERVRIVESKITLGAANPAPKLAILVAGMCAGADSIDDADVVRSGGMKDPVQRGLRAIDDRNPVAGVQFRPRVTARLVWCQRLSRLGRAAGRGGREIGMDSRAGSQ